LDNFVRDPADRLDRRFYHVSRGEWANSPIAGFRGGFPYFAFRFGPKGSLIFGAPGGIKQWNLSI
jgi:hypothetical protein